MLLTSDQEAFRDSVRTMARREYYDGYLERARSSEFPWPALRSLGRNGLLGLSLPSRLGGQEADPVSVGVACEELAYADFNLGYLIFAAEVASALVGSSSEPDVAAAISSICSGEGLLALALTEPQGGSDASALRVKAMETQGGYHLHGEKTSITLGPHADFALVVATTNRAEGSRATRRFLVPLDDPTIARQSFDDPGFRPLGRAGLTFDETFVPAAMEIRGASNGLAAQLADFDYTRTLLGLLAIGAAQRALDTTIQWVRDRHAFGQPIARFQGVSFSLAEHDTMIEAARALCYLSLNMRARGARHTRQAAMCKWFAPRVAFDAINDCVVLHGHAGWSMEFPLQQLLLDVSGLQIGDGTPQIQKLVIARSLVGREFVG